MKRRPAWRFPVFVLLLALSVLLSAPAAGSGDAVLRGYSADNGYVYVLLGRYPQTAEGEVRPILWRVLDTDDEKAILLSEYILFARCMNASLLAYREEIRGDFSRTDLCAYLNSEFAADAFTGEETAALLPMENFGKVFLPSADDLKNRSYGLGETLLNSKNAKKIMQDPGLRAWGTEWAIRNNGYDPAEYPDVKKKIQGSSGKEMPLKELRLFEYSASRGSHSPYWTRDASAHDGRHARCVKATGGIGHIEVGRDNEGVRPMVWLDRAACTVVSGTGEKDDPFVIVPRGE